jgi:fucose 4-O-acetylase-like acetyltransferase
MKIRNFDLLKGILIILVITGHILQGSLSENIVRNIIYSFHMPLFIGITGYLAFSGKAAESGFSGLVKKYLFRILIPWTIAILAYLIILNYNILSGLSIKGIIAKTARAFISPYYHLWYISAFFSWVCFTFLLLKMKLNKSWILLLGFCISFFFYLLEYKIIIPESHFLKQINEIIIHTFRPYFYVYFVLGIFLRKSQPLITLNNNLLLILLLGLAQAFVIVYPSEYVNIGINLAFNAVLLHLMITLSLADRLPHMKVIEWLGVNSLPVYLWHLVPVLLLKLASERLELNTFYLYCFFSELFLIITIFFLSRSAIINRYVFGMTRS